MANDRIKFHLDEHIAPEVAEALRRRGIDVTTTIDARLQGCDDATHFEFATRSGRVIVTRDVDFLRLAANTSDHAGIGACRRRGLSVSEIINGLILIHDVLSPGEMVGHTEYL